MRSRLSISPVLQCALRARPVADRSGAACGTLNSTAKSLAQQLRHSAVAVPFSKTLSGDSKFGPVAQSVARMLMSAAKRLLLSNTQA
jgi:hypothetical protein